MVNTKIDNYQDLKDGWQFTIGNKNVDSFDTSKLTIDQENQLKNYCGIEYVIEGDGNEDDLEQEYLISLKNFISEFESKFYIFVAEYDAKPKSKIRSYKGLVRKESLVDESDVIDVEVDMKNECSLFASMIRIDESNSQHFISEYFYNSDICFLINESSVFNADFIHNMINLYTNERGIFTINYLDLVLNTLTESGLIVRNGGYHEDNIFSFQIFAHKLMRMNVNEKLLPSDPSLQKKR